MPRDGSGQGDNSITPEDAGHNVIHGAGKEVSKAPITINPPCHDYSSWSTWWLPDAASDITLSRERLTASQTTDHVARADKTAPLPEHEKGAAVEGLGASGGGDKLEKLQKYK